MLKDLTGTRGRPRGSKKVIKGHQEEKQLTDQERFQLLQSKLLAELHHDDIRPRKLKKIITHKMETAGIRHHEKGAKLWARTLLQRGQYREDIKDQAKCTVFGNISVYEFPDGLQMELPLGYSLQPRKTKEAIEIAQAYKIEKLINKIMM